MKIWTSEHVFNHNWDAVVTSQFRKYPNPHNTAVLGTDVYDRRVDPETGILHSHRIITSDWALAPWVQRLIGANRECYAHEYSSVDPKSRMMEMKSINLTFCSFVNMKEQMSYFPHPEDQSKTIMRQETIVTVKGVPLTSYMESIIVNTVSSNANKGRSAIDWVVDAIGKESKNISGVLDKITDHVQELRDTVADNIITTAKSSIDDLRRSLPDLSEVSKDISSIQVQCSRSVPRSILSAEETISIAAQIPVSTSSNHLSHDST